MVVPQPLPGEAATAATRAAKEKRIERRIAQRRRSRAALFVGWDEWDGLGYEGEFRVQERAAFILLRLRTAVSLRWGMRRSELI